MHTHCKKTQNLVLSTVLNNKYEAKKKLLLSRTHFRTCLRWNVVAPPTKSRKTREYGNKYLVILVLLCLEGCKTLKHHLSGNIPSIFIILLTVKFLDTAKWTETLCWATHQDDKQDEQRYERQRLVVRNQKNMCASIMTLFLQMIELFFFLRKYSKWL